MKKYLIFTGSHYYPCGGFGDYVGTEDTQEAAESVALELCHDWWQVCVFDGEALKMVSSGGRP